MNPNPPPPFSSEPSYDGPLRLRWRGREEGPFPWAEIERRLTANEIGLFHEVQVDGAWMPLRAFLELREAARQEAKARREEAERVANVHAARAAEERAARHQSEVLAEEKRKNDLMAAALGLPQGKKRPMSFPRLLRNTALILVLVCGGFAAYQAYRIPELTALSARAREVATKFNYVDSPTASRLGINLFASLFGDARDVRDAIAEVSQAIGDKEKLQQRYQWMATQLSAELETAGIARNWALLLGCCFAIAAICFHFGARNDQTV